MCFACKEIPVSSFSNAYISALFTAKEFQGQEFNTVWQVTLLRYDWIIFSYIDFNNDTVTVIRSSWQPAFHMFWPFLVLFQRASNEYFDMVIFMTFFILVSIICFILLLKVSLKVYLLLILIFNQFRILAWHSSTVDCISIAYF